MVPHDEEGLIRPRFLTWITEYDAIRKDPMKLINKITDAWTYGNTGFVIKNKYNGKYTVELHCLGDSQNEKMITALMGNEHFFALYWERSIAGGHYRFKIPPPTKLQRLNNYISKLDD